MDTSQDSLSFAFDVQLEGGAKKCFYLQNLAAKDNSNQLIKLAFKRLSNRGRYASDLQVLFQSDQQTLATQTIGGNPFGLNYAGMSIGEFYSSYRRPIDDCVYGTDYATSPISSFNEICIFNACGSFGVYCSDPVRFVGQIIVDGFTTSSIAKPGSFSPPCQVSEKIVDSLD